MNKYILEILPKSEEAKTKYINLSNNHIIIRNNDNAGFDLFTSSDVSVKDSVEFLPFDISARMLKITESGSEEECHYWLAPRSSIFKSGLIMANSLGVIDSTYRGELKAPVWSVCKNSEAKKGERLFQILAPDMGHICQIRIVEYLPNTQRGEGGFGSSGK